MPRRAAFGAIVLASICALSPPAIGGGSVEAVPQNGRGIVLPAPTKVPAWIAGLKCRDLLKPNKAINEAVFPTFAVWINGYLSGLGSALKLSLLPAKSFDLFRWADPTSVGAMVLTVCSAPQHGNDSAVETTIDAASMVVNLSSKHTVRLRGPDGKWD